MFEARQTSARSRSRNATVALPTRSFAPEHERLQLLPPICWRLGRAIRRAVLACLLWRLSVYRDRQRPRHADWFV